MGSSLTSVTIPEGVTSIGEWVFCDCSSLTSVTIPEGVTNIGEMAFSACINLKDVYIPNSVKKIAHDAFLEIDDNDWDDEYYWDLPMLDLTIHGYLGSYAETYAKKRGFKFSAIDGPVSLSNAKVTVSAQVYSGKAKKAKVK